LVSIGRLLEVSRYVRALYLQYPETAAREIRKQIPQLLDSLLRVAWALHNVSKEDFDAENALDLLRYNGLHDWPIMFPQLFTTTDDPLESIQGLIDLYVEVDSAAGLVAQGMNAVMEAFRNPYVVVAPITLSDTEHTCIVCALLTVRIYYQLRSKFGPVHALDTPACNFPRTFIQSLKPWQVEQAVSVEGFVDKCLKPNTAYIYEVIDSKYRCWEYFSARSPYFRKYKNATALDNDFQEVAIDNRPLSFSSAVRNRNYPNMQLPWYYDENRHVSTEMSQLRTHGWVLFNSIGLVATMRRHHYERAFLALGMFFWDQNRLASWELIELDDIKRLHNDIDRKLKYFSNLRSF
jgi:hypothetical protein